MPETILVAMVTTCDGALLATAKLVTFEQNFQLQNCLEFYFEQLCNWKFFSKINSFQDMITSKLKKSQFYVILYVENHWF